MGRQRPGTLALRPESDLDSRDREDAFLRGDRRVWRGGGGRWHPIHRRRRSGQAFLPGPVRRLARGPARDGDALVHHFAAVHLAIGQREREMCVSRTAPQATHSTVVVISLTAGRMHVSPDSVVGTLGAESAASSTASHGCHEPSATRHEGRPAMEMHSLTSSPRYTCEGERAEAASVAAPASRPRGRRTHLGGGGETRRGHATRSQSRPSFCGREGGGGLTRSL